MALAHCRLAEESPRTAARSPGHILLLELVPEKNFAIGILTNATNGWRLIQDVEREVLKQYHGATFPKNTRSRIED